MNHIHTIRTRMVLPALAFLLTCSLGMVSPHSAFSQGGPVLVMGIDAEEGGANGHGPLTAYRSIVDGLLAHTSNNATTDVLVVGVKSGGPVLNFWWNLTNLTPVISRQFIQGSQINTVDFNDYKLVVVVTDFQNVLSGLTAAENFYLRNRADDLRAFINCGGGVLGFTGPMNSTYSNWYDYLDFPGLGQTAFSYQGNYTNIAISNPGASAFNSDVVTGFSALVSAPNAIFHNTYSSFPPALSTVLVRSSDNTTAAFGAPNVYANTLPTADAGADQTIECTSHTGMSATLSGTGSDADGDPITYEWWYNGNLIGTTASIAVNNLMAGTHTFTFKVSDDQCGGVSTDDVVITVEDTQPPVISGVGADQSVTCPDDPYSYFSSPMASDDCDPNPSLTYTDITTQLCGATYSVTRTWTATDASNNFSTASKTITLVDNTAPVITTNADVTLWPPNHEYESFDIDDMAASVSDACNSSISTDDVTIHSVWSDEPENATGNGDGDTYNDIVIACDFQSVMLRKERAGSGNGRVYTVKLQVSDGCNTGYVYFNVNVPRSVRSMAVNDGATAGYTVSACAVPKQSADHAVPAGMTLSQNYPNPFNPSTSISFTLPETANVSLRVFDLHGREVATIANGDFSSGTHTLSFDAANLPSGMYIYRLESNGAVISRTMQLMK
ncbi:MAG: T9SS type A sorting domain-containing protein [Bacteroidetes bacterium]|nr:T9SS type A sorting domain-containing protein [Bacteroidota bacterium]